MPCTEEQLVALRNALAHLHDPAYLENHPLAQRLDFVAQAPGASRGQLLRRTLRLSIEALDPGAGVPANSPEARPYQVLRGRYILRQSWGEVAAQLDISRRQMYRELHRALEALAQMLWQDQGAGEAASGAKVDSSAARVQAEVERLTTVSQQDVDLAELVQSVLKSVGPLAAERGIQLDAAVEPGALRVATNRVMLRQALLNLLSHIVGVHQGAPVRLCLARRGQLACIEIRYRSATPPDLGKPDQPYAVAAQLLETLGLDWQSAHRAEGEGQIQIRVPLVSRPSVLIIDDNQGLIRLFERYLQDQPYQLVGVTDPNQALELVESLRPDVIILDIMMPQRDGWEILEALRQGEAGRRAKVLVCSIINDPQLSAALGADAFLHKPVDRARLLQVLEGLVSSAT
jgi:CheY-like chemotaxis protein